MLEMSQLRGPSCSAGTNTVSHLVPITAVLKSNLLSLYRSPCKRREGQLHEWECSLGETDSSCPKSAPPAELCALGGPNPRPAVGRLIQPLLATAAGMAPRFSVLVFHLLVNYLAFAEHSMTW